ncbi:MAG: ubiquinone/menaquinone biosynthesis methyltransferase [Chloroflexi bacterium]|nr:ubiquinone/menaquinone biosynthesis methyltransferase [Chloroflexota bacterium]
MSNIAKTSIKDPGFESEWSQNRKKDVKELFKVQAKKYDLHDDIIGLGMHRMWARQVMKSIGAFVAGRDEANLLDLGCGTGFIAFRVAQKYSNIDIDGFDITEEMIEVAKQRQDKYFANRKMNFWVGDAEIPYGQDKYDVITTCFAFRNYANKALATENIFKALKPGGMLVIQEMTKPEHQPMRGIYLFALKNFLPVIGKIIGVAPASPQYLYKTVMLMPKNKDVKTLLEEKGFSNVSYKSMSFGIGTVIVGYKPA